MSIRECIVFIVCMLIAACSNSNPAAENAGALVAEHWLNIVDSNEYQTSWDQAATMFQARVTKAEWSKLLTDARTPLGSLQSRKLAKTKFRTSLPGAPDGEYVVSVFKSSYQQKAKAVETVTVAKNQNDWRVVGYQVK